MLARTGEAKREKKQHETKGKMTHMAAQNGASLVEPFFNGPSETPSMTPFTSNPSSRRWRRFHHFCRIRAATSAKDVRRAAVSSVTSGGRSWDSRCLLARPPPPPSPAALSSGEAATAARLRRWWLGLAPGSSCVTCSLGSGLGSSSDDAGCFFGEWWCTRWALWWACLAVLSQRDAPEAAASARRTSRTPRSSRPSAS